MRKLSEVRDDYLQLEAKYRQWLVGEYITLKELYEHGFDYIEDDTTGYSLGHNLTSLMKQVNKRPHLEDYMRLLDDTRVLVVAINKYRDVFTVVVVPKNDEEKEEVWSEYSI